MLKIGQQFGRSSRVPSVTTGALGSLTKAERKTVSDSNAPNPSENADNKKDTHVEGSSRVEFWRFALTCLPSETKSPQFARIGSDPVSVN